MATTNPIFESYIKAAEESLQNKRQDDPAHAVTYALLAIGERLSYLVGLLEEHNAIAEHMLKHIIENQN